MRAVVTADGQLAVGRWRAHALDHKPARLPRISHDNEVAHARRLPGEGAWIDQQPVAVAQAGFHAVAGHGDAIAP